MKVEIFQFYENGVLDEVNVLTSKDDKLEHQIMHRGTVNEAIEAIIRTMERELEIQCQQQLEINKDIKELRNILLDFKD